MSSNRGIPRREFVKSAVAIGGASALSACTGRFGSPNVDQGPNDLSSLPERQHAWNDYLSTDKYGNVVPPRHRVLLYLGYSNHGTPDGSDRKRVESALRSLEHAYKRGNDGLLFTISYSPSYFDRFDASLPPSVDLQKPRALASFESPKLDTPDAVLHLASDHGQVVLAAEQAMRGKKDKLNGVDVSAALTDVFSVADRRTGFTGSGLPHSNQDVSGVPDSKPVGKDAPLYMGYKSTFTKSMATEDRVSIRDGPFADGSTQHISHMQLNLDQWYEQDGRFQQVGKMFCPHHAEQKTVKGTGANLGTDSAMDQAKKATDAAREDGLVGHSQKMVSVRENGRPIILRRDFDSTDGGHAGLHFLALQRGIGDFVKTRQAMNGTDLASNSAVGQRNNNGILQYIDVTHRGNYFLPPRSLRALPTADPTGSSYA